MAWRCVYTYRVRSVQARMYFNRPRTAENTLYHVVYLLSHLFPGAQPKALEIITLLRHHPCPRTKWRAKISQQAR